MKEILSSDSPKLTILDVGHGSAAVLVEQSRVAVFDAGRGNHLRRFLKEAGVSKIDFLILSHADFDHIGGAISVLLDQEIEVSTVFINPDPTKKSKASFKQFQAAVGEATRLQDTALEVQLTVEVTEKFSGGEVEIEVVYPSALRALGGVGGISENGAPLTSNSLSAALLLSYAGEGVFERELLIEHLLKLLSSSV